MDMHQTERPRPSATAASVRLPVPIIYYCIPSQWRTCLTGHWILKVTPGERTESTDEQNVTQTEPCADLEVALSQQGMSSRLKCYVNTISNV